MPSIILVDTCIFLNALNVPAFNQHRKAVLTEIERLSIDTGVNLLLPMAAIIETGNHIAQLSSGGNRRRLASIFAEQVKDALHGNAPWRAMQAPKIEEIEEWLKVFPYHAMHNVGMGDLSIIKEWSAVKSRHSAHNVTIWTLDQAMRSFADVHEFDT